MDLNTITDDNTRLAWRQHLVLVAVSEDQADEECDDRTPEERNAFTYGMAMLIGNATFLMTESTSDVETAVYERIIATREERKREEAESLLERWRMEIASGGTFRGFKEWAADRE